MFEHIKQKQEREAAKESQHAINSMKSNDYLAISHHISSLIIAIVAFCLIFSSVGLSSTNSNETIIGYGLQVIAGILVLFHGFNKRKSSYLNKYVYLIVRIKSLFIRHWYADYLAKYFWASIAVLLSVSGILLHAYITGQSGWTSPKSYQGESYSSSVTMIISTASGLLAAQIALFSFMMQQVLSKYSGVVAQTVASHRAIKLLALFPVVGLLIPFLLHNVGAPTSIENLVLPAIGGMLLLGLFLTVMVAKSGLSESLAIRYFGVASSSKLFKAIPVPIKTISRFSKNFWKILYYLGLDFRNKNLFQAIAIPINGANITIESLNASLGVANKAAIEGQHDVFVSSLVSIEIIMNAYAARRKLYCSSEDEVFIYLNYQFSALIESTAKIPNQYLISNLTSSIGKIANLTYCIGNIPADMVEKHRHYNSNNFTTSQWMELLIQCFENTHMLTRSTAAHATLRQMSELALTSIVNKDSDAITLTYLPAIKKVFLLCVVKMSDPYHKELAGLCLTNLMSNLMNITSYRDSLRGTHEDPYEETLNQITYLSKLYLAADKTGSMTLNDPLNIVLTKTATEKYCIQEVFFVIANKNLPNSYSYRVANSDMEKIVERLNEMATYAMNLNVYSSSYYLNALFEILYLVVRGLPEKFSEYDEIEGQERAMYRFSEEAISTEQRLIELICDKLNELITIFYRSKRSSIDWQHSVFSSLGILIIRFADKKEEFIKVKVIEVVTNYYFLINNDIEGSNRTHYDSEKYLQLVAAWMKYFNVDKVLTQNIEDLLTSIKRDSRGYGSLRDKYGLFGYPTLHHNDFYLYPIENIRHPQIMSEEYSHNFGDLGNRLINDKVLLPFAKGIRSKVDKMAIPK